MIRARMWRGIIRSTFAGQLRRPPRRHPREALQRVPPVCCNVSGIRDPWVFLIPSRC